MGIKSWLLKNLFSLNFSDGLVKEMSKYRLLSFFFMVISVSFCSNNSVACYLQWSFSSWVSLVRNLGFSNNYRRIFCNSFFCRVGLLATTNMYKSKNKSLNLVLFLSIGVGNSTISLIEAEFFMALFLPVFMVFFTATLVKYYDGDFFRSKSLSFWMPGDRYTSPKTIPSDQFRKDSAMYSFFKKMLIKQEIPQDLNILVVNCRLIDGFGPAMEIYSSNFMGDSEIMLRKSSFLSLSPETRLIRFSHWADSSSPNYMVIYVDVFTHLPQVVFKLNKKETLGSLRGGFFGYTSQRAIIQTVIEDSEAIVSKSSGGIVSGNWHELVNVFEEALQQFLLRWRRPCVPKMFGGVYGAIYKNSRTPILFGSFQEQNMFNTFGSDLANLMTQFKRVESCYTPYKMFFLDKSNSVTWDVNLLHLESFELLVQVTNLSPEAILFKILWEDRGTVELSTSM